MVGLAAAAESREFEAEEPSASFAADRVTLGDMRNYSTPTETSTAVSSRRGPQAAWVLDGKTLGERRSGWSCSLCSDDVEETQGRIKRTDELPRLSRKGSVCCVRCVGSGGVEMLQGRSDSVGGHLALHGQRR